MNLDLVLVDTSVWLLALGKAGMPAAKERVDQLLQENRVTVAPVVYLELLGGTRTVPEFNRLKSRLESLRQLEIERKEWQEAAKLAFELRRKGKTIPYTDILIAATAIESGATLLHADRHFDVIAGITDLSVDSMVQLIGK